MFSLKKIVVGEKVEAEFIERLPSGDFIVSFGGDLLRVKNRSQVNFRNGQKVELVVKDISPLSFVLEGSAMNNSPHSGLSRRYDRQV